MTQANTPVVPSKTLTVKVDGNEREILMSYGLQDQLLRLIRDTNEIGNIYADPDVRNAIIEQILAERSPSGKIINKRTFDDYILEVEDAETILAWAVDHITAFFIRVIGVLDKKMTPMAPVETP